MTAALIALPGPGRALAGPRCGLVLSSGSPCVRPEGHAGKHKGVLTHGYGSYTRGCRCDTCRDAKADYMRRRRTTPAAGFVLTDPGVRHGTRHAYEERGCRCDECVAFQPLSSRHPLHAREGRVMIPPSFDDPLFAASHPDAAERAQGSPADDFPLPCTPTAAGDMTTASPPPPGGDAVPEPAEPLTPVRDSAEGGTPEGVRPAPARRTAGSSSTSRNTSSGASLPDGKAVPPAGLPRLSGGTAPGLRGKAAMDAVRAEQARQAKERRKLLGRLRRKPGYQAGGNIRYPGGTG